MARKSGGHSGQQVGGDGREIGHASEGGQEIRRVSGGSQQAGGNGGQQASSGGREIGDEDFGDFQELSAILVISECNKKNPRTF
jgi:hypothetical protein